MYFLRIFKMSINFYKMATIKNSDDLRWQAESDARTMAQYQEILQDKARMNRAIKEANKQAADLQKRTNAMKAAAGTRSKKK